MKKIYLIFVFLLLISCKFRTGTDVVEKSLETISILPGTQIIVAGESMNSDYILQVELDGRITVLENKSDTAIGNPKEKYREILAEIK